MNRLMIILLMIVVILPISCAGMRTTRNIVPVPSTDSTIFQRTKGIAMTKNNISVIAVYLQSEKELDGFGVMIVNETPNWISLRKDECMLVQDGKVIYPLPDAKVSARLGADYKQKMPSELNVDIYEWRRDVNIRSSRGSRTVDTKVMDKDEKGNPIIKISLVPGSKETIFLFFNTQGSNADMQLIIPNIYNEATKERTSFTFRFTVEKK